VFYVYLLKSKKDNRLYIGYSSDLKKRVKMHNSGKVVSTKNRYSLVLIYYEAYRSEKDARRRENQLKGISSQRESLKRRLRNSLE